MITTTRTLERKGHHLRGMAMRQSRLSLFTVKMKLQLIHTTVAQRLASTVVVERPYSLRGICFHSLSHSLTHTHTPFGLWGPSHTTQNVNCCCLGPPSTPTVLRRLRSRMDHTWNGDEPNVVLSLSLSLSLSLLLSLGGFLRTSEADEPRFLCLERRLVAPQAPDTIQQAPLIVARCELQGITMLGWVVGDITAGIIISRALDSIERRRFRFGAESMVLSYSQERKIAKSSEWYVASEGTRIDEMSQDLFHFWGKIRSCF